jgi:acetyl-CoA carboxylase carboxyltransferase component
MSWQKEIDELKRRRELAKQMGGPDGIARQHSRGKLTVRERIDLLLDQNSFQEIGTLAGSASYDEQGELKSFTPGNYVTGHGKIDGRPVCVQGGDFTIRGGASDVSGGVAKGIYIEKMAQEWRIPLVRLLEAVGGSVRTFEEIGRTYVPESQWIVPAVALMGQVPVVSAVLGSAAGWVAIMAAVAHWSIMTRTTSELFVAGPPLIERALSTHISKEEVGSYKIHAYKSGVIDNVGEDERDVFRQIRLFLSYLPQNVWQLPPRVETGDDPNRRDEELLSIIPRDRKKPYDIRQLINHIVDRDSVFELSPFYGRSLVTLFARMDGYPVAVMSNDCRWFGGAQTAAASEKMVRFMDLADTFHLPIIYLVDQPGFMIGQESEEEGTVRKGARALFAMYQVTTPWISVIIRKCYGVAGAIHRSNIRLDLRYAWPSAEWGSLPIAGGAMAAFRREIEAAPDPEAMRIQIEKRLEQLTSPFRTAEAFGVEEMIDPRETRPLLCEFVRRAWEINATQLGPKSRVGVRP